MRHVDGAEGANAYRVNQYELSQFPFAFFRRLASCHSALRERTRRVKRWQSGTMALRWAAASLDAASKNFRRIMGHQHLWMLKAALDESQADHKLAQEIKAG